MEIFRKKEKQPLSFFERLNNIILILNFIFPVWIFALMLTSAISDIFFLVAIAANIALAVTYKLVQKLGKEGKILLPLRIIAVLASLSIYLPSVVLFGFTENKFMYPVKRYVYTHGVFGRNHEYYDNMLPEKLPDICDDFSFRTQGSMVAQDYHPSSYLIFHTDTASLSEIAAHYDAMLGEKCTKIEGSPLHGGDIYDENGEPYAPDETNTNPHLHWFCGQMRLDRYCSDNVENSVMYYFGGYYPKAVLLVPDTGLVAILT